MALDILILLLGLATLILGGDVLVRGASRMGLRFNLSPLVVGLTIVAFSTSAPELFVSLSAALKGVPDFALGNVVGSNISNLALVLGVASLFGFIPIKKITVCREWPVTFVASVLLYLLLLDGSLVQREGIILFACLVAYLVFLLYYTQKDPVKSGVEMPKPDESQFKGTSKNPCLSFEAIFFPDTSLAKYSFNAAKLRFCCLISEKNLRFKFSKWVFRSTLEKFKDFFLIILGGACLYFGSDWFIESAEKIASSLGVSERIIGLTVLALGTSLPELSTSIIAARKGETDLVLGNLFGSNIFNILSILGITSIFSSLEVNPKIINGDMVWMLGLTLGILPLMVFRKRLGTISGMILLAFYVLYSYTILH